MARKTVAQLEDTIRFLADKSTKAEERESEWKRRCRDLEQELETQRGIARVAEREADRLRGWMDRVREEQQPQEVVIKSIDIAGKSEYEIGSMIRTMLANGAEQCLRG